ncbi:hypothetical protein GCM10010201_19130 [Pilimelia columellifera subsp. columellifera]|uniref:Uncharacterized protein n=1 Tax=Pilimelia columellifera subsp. columellifera TaxID=706583 RepID=A0ABP6ARE2_9ACTN
MCARPVLAEQFVGGGDLLACEDAKLIAGHRHFASLSIGARRRALAWDDRAPSDHPASWGGSRRCCGGEHDYLHGRLSTRGVALGSEALTSPVAGDRGLIGAGSSDPRDLDYRTPLACHHSTVSLPKRQCHV